MHKIIVALFLIFVFGQKAYSSGIILNPDSKGIDITITSLDAASVKAPGQDSLNALTINNTAYAVPVINGEYLTDEVQFIIAVPENIYYSNDKIKPEIKTGDPEDLNLPYPGLNEHYDNHSTTDYYYLFNPKSNPNGLNPYVYIKKLGIQRGLPLIAVNFQPFYFNPAEDKLSLYDDFRIRIDFGEKIGIVQNGLSPLQKDLYGSVVNKENIVPILDKRSPLAYKENSNKTQEEVWYDPAKTYVKLITTKDGIAVADASGIVSTEPSLRGKSLSGFHLIHNGVEVPIYFLNDNDGILNSGDRIIFIGSRAKGDTTWYENYTWNEIFYLYFDDSAEGLRFTDFPKVNKPKPTVDVVNIFRHYEYDKTWFWGYYLDVTETVDTEGWYWKETTPFYDQFFRDSSFFFLPVDNGGNISFKMAVASVKRDEQELKNTPDLKHKVGIRTDGNAWDVVRFNFEQRYIYNKNISPDKLTPGRNVVELKNIGDFDTNPNIKIDAVSVDYYEINAKSKPFAVNGVAEFSTDKLSTDATLNVPGFDNSDYIVIDKENNFINTRPSSYYGAFITAGAQGTDEPYISIDINDSSYIEKGPRGFHIAVLRAPDYKDFEKKYFDAGNEAITAYIKGLPKGSVVAVVYNGDADIPASVQDYFTSAGSQKIAAASAANPWIFVFRNNEKGTYSERAGNAYYVNYSGFFVIPGGSGIRAELGLKGNYKYDFIMSQTDKMENAAIGKVYSTDLRNKDYSADVIFIANREFSKEANEYVNYRKQSLPDMDIKLVFADDIYKEFGYGRKSPHTIKSFLRYCYYNWKKAPYYLVLYGDASDDPRKVGQHSVNTDYIPTYGTPTSDFWYTLLDGDDYLNDMIVGRIPVNNSEEAQDYLDKVKVYEGLSNQIWMKNALFISGGLNDFEREKFFGVIQSAGGYLYNSPYCIDTILVKKNDPAIVSEAEATKIIKSINEGSGWVTFFGHGSQRVFDVEGWAAGELSNKNKYGFLSTFSCNTGAYATNEYRTRNEDYIFAKNTGFIGASGGTAVGREDLALSMLIITDRMIIDTTIGDFNFTSVLNRAKNKIVAAYNADPKRTPPEITNLIMQYNVTADPLLKFRLNIKPDLYTYSSDLEIKNNKGGDILLSTDSTISITGKVFNQGPKTDGKVTISLIREYNGRYDTLTYQIDRLCREDIYHFDLRVFDMAGIHKLKIIVDNDNEIDDPDRSNNIISKDIEVFTAGVISLDPLPYWNKKANNPVFRVINPQAGKAYNANYTYEFFISEKPGIDGEHIASSNSSDVYVKENYIDWKPEIELEKNKNYWFEARMIDQNTSKKSAWLTVPFHTSVTEEKENTGWVQSDVNLLTENRFENLDSTQNSSGVSLVLRKESLPFDVTGVHGVSHGDTVLAWPGSEIIYNNKIYVTTPPVVNGFTMVVVDGKTFDVKAVRSWKTFTKVMDDGKFLPPDKDSSTMNFVKYMRDTVTADDYILFATNGNAFNVPRLQNEFHLSGSLDTIKQVFREFGAHRVDSINEGASYVLVGKKGWTNAYEDFNIVPDPEGRVAKNKGDTAHVAGFLVRKYENGKLTTPLIGPAKSWDKFDLSGYFPDGSQYMARIYGMNKQSGETNELKTSSGGGIDLSDIDASEYPYLYADIVINRTDENVEPYLDSIIVKFDPAPELAILKSRTMVVNDSIMRAEDMNFNFGVENISLRSASAKNSMDILILSPAGAFLDEKNPEIPQLGSSENEVLRLTLPTDYYEEYNNLTYTVNSGRTVNELYFFNNTGKLNFSIYEDTIKPYILVTFDDDTLKDGDYVASKPYVVVEMFDNSRLVVNDEDKFKVLINSDLNMVRDDEDYHFESYNKDATPLKAKISFSIDTIEYRHNIISVWFEDATGNKDSIDINFFYSYNGSVDNLNNYPNPFSDNTVFKFNYKGPSDGSEATIIVYDLNGKKIRTLHKTIGIGDNPISWDGRDDYGNSVPSGVYLYIVIIRGDAWVPNKTGKCMINR